MDITMYQVMRFNEAISAKSTKMMVITKMRPSHTFTETIVATDNTDMDNNLLVMYVNLELKDIRTINQYK